MLQVVCGCMKRELERMSEKEGCESGRKRSYFSLRGLHSYRMALWEALFLDCVLGIQIGLM